MGASCAPGTQRGGGDCGVFPGRGGYLAGLGGAVGSDDGDEFLPSPGRVLRGLGCQEPEVNVVTRDHG